MGTTIILVLTACFFGAGLVYVFLAVRHYGEKQVITDKLLKEQTETAEAKKKLLAHTKYADHLDAGKQAMADQLKPPVAKVVREYVHVMQIAKDKYKLKSDATVIARYSVEFAFALDLNAAGLEVSDADHGIVLKLSRPSLVGDPVVKQQPHQIVSASTLPDQHVIMPDVHANFAALARRYGTAIAAEDAVRAQCKLKALECLRDFLVKQPGVRHVPAIFADFK